MIQALSHSDLFGYSPEALARPIARGVKCATLGLDSGLHVAKVWFDTGASSVEERCTSAKAGYVLDGFFEVDIGGKTQILGPGGSYHVPPEARVRTRCIETGTLLDIRIAGAAAEPRYFSTVCAAMAEDCQ